MTTRLPAWAAGIAAACIMSSAANAGTVTQFESSFAGNGIWFDSDVRAGGTTGVESLIGQGGNLEGNAPLPTGAAKLTTGPSNADKAEVAVTGNFGTVGQFLQSGSLAYDYFKQALGDLNPSAAAAIKFSVLDTNITSTSSTDGFTTFVYEPTWNIGPVGSSVVVPTDDWANAVVTGNSGVLWHTGIYGAGNQGGFGGDGNTLADWVAFFSDDLLDASIIAISVGIGTFNQGQTAYFDNVLFSNGDINLAYDFEVAPIPLPAALPLYGTGLAIVGFLGWRRRRKTTALEAA